MNDEAAQEGRLDVDQVALSLSTAAALPDPGLYRQELPGSIRRAYERGEIGEEEVWLRLTRLWSLDEVVRFVARLRRAA